MAPDGPRLAYAKVGQGPPLVKAANWLSHLEYDWNSPVWQPWLQAWSRFHTLYRYDERGCGLSDWEVADFSLEAWVRDLETVVDAAGLERFSLFGMSQGGAVAIAYAARHPERVSRLILYGTYIRGFDHSNPTPDQRKEEELNFELMKVGWGQDNSKFHQIYATWFVPEGTQEQVSWFNNLQPTSCSPENAIRMARGFHQIDVQDIAPTLKLPTLVMHLKDDRAVSFDEGRWTAAHIPGARFIPLEGKNHIILTNDPGWSHFWREFYQFLGVPSDQLSATPAEAKTPADDSLFAELTPREQEVLRLLAKGYHNAQIAQTLVLSPKTVRNYVSNIYAKIQVNSRNEAISLVRRTDL